MNTEDIIVSSGAADNDNRKVKVILSFVKCFLHDESFNLYGTQSNQLWLVDKSVRTLVHSTYVSVK